LGHDVWPRSINVAGLVRDQDQKGINNDQVNLRLLPIPPL
jgi:hypothetical protein